jgi:hypothetical protein
LPKAIPQGRTAIRSGLFRFGSRYYPRHYAGDYVIEWEGDADLRFGFGHQNQRRVGRSRVEAYFHPADESWSNVEITRIGSGGLRNLRVYRKEHEARVKAGETFDPRFLAYASRYKVLRTLDIQAAVISDIRSAGRLKKKGQAGYGAPAVAVPGAPDAPVGAPIEVLFDLAMAADAALWMHVPTLLGAPSVFDELGIESPRRGELRATAKARFAEIFASSEWRAFADEIVRALEASGYPENRMLYLEVSNEVWNFAHPFWWPTNYFWGIGDALGDRGYSYGLGYAVAHWTATFDGALKAAGRAQAWTPVLAGQMANPETTKGALAGFRRYFEDRGQNPRSWLARVGVSTASYYHGALEPDGVVKVAAGENYRAKWLAAVVADPVGLAQRLGDWYVNGSDRQVGAIPYLVRMRNENQRLAEEAGAFFLGDYEGENHENGGGDLKSEPAFVNWMENWRRGPDGERTARAWVEALYRQNPDAIIANYKGIGPSDPEGDSPGDRILVDPWYDGFYGETNGRTRALDANLRGPAPPQQ